MSATNGLSDAQAERLALLAEEMGEAQQAIGKILRFGFEDPHPRTGVTARQMLEREVGDVRAVLRLMVLERDIDAVAMERGVEGKIARMKRFLREHHPMLEHLA